MAMLPIFFIGFIVGIVVSCAFYKYKQDTPSDLKIRLQEDEIRKQKADNEMLEKLVEKLYKTIDELKEENNKK